MKMAKTLIIDDIEIAELNRAGDAVAFLPSCSLDRREVRTVIEALKTWLETGSFPDAK